MINQASFESVDLKVFICKQSKYCNGADLYMENYFKERDKKTLDKIKSELIKLPEFCEYFVIGTETFTTPLTRLNYLQDMAIFFDFLLKEVKEFSELDLREISLSNLEKVSPLHIEKYISYLSNYVYNGNNNSNGLKTKARKLSSIKTFFKYYYNHDMLTQNIASKIVMPKLKDKPILRLEGGEVGKVLNTTYTGELLKPREKAFHNKTKERDYAIIILLLGTGMRVSECVGLNLPDVDLINKSVKITRKGGNIDILYYNDEVKFALNDYLLVRENTDTIALFVSMQNTRICVRSVQNLVKKYAKAVNPLKNITPHKLRSTFGTDLYNSTKDIYVVAEVLGHKDINTTKKHYAHISDEIKKSASQKVNFNYEYEDK